MLSWSGLNAMVTWPELPKLVRYMNSVTSTGTLRFLFKLNCYLWPIKCICILKSLRWNLWSYASDNKIHCGHETPCFNVFSEFNSERSEIQSIRTQIMSVRLSKAVFLHVSRLPQAKHGGDSRWTILIICRVATGASSLYYIGHPTMNYLDIFKDVIRWIVSIFCQASHSEYSRY